MTDVQLTAPPVDLDSRAERLLRLGLSAAVLIRDGGPEMARRSLRQLDHGELLDLATLLAGCVDIDRPESELLGWWLCRPVIPEHADERYGDAPPLQVGVHRV